MFAVADDDPQSPPRDELRLFDGQPTRLYFTGNPHHPTFGREKLAKLLDRYFDGKSPIVVDGLADARKDPVTQKPIRPAKIPVLIRFLEPVFEAREAAARKVGWDSVPTSRRNEGTKAVGTESQPTVKPRERLVVLSYVIVEAPRSKPAADWVKTSADELQQYGQDALQQ